MLFLWLVRRGLSLLQILFSQLIQLLYDVLWKYLSMVRVCDMLGTPTDQFAKIIGCYVLCYLHAVSSEYYKY